MPVAAQTSEQIKPLLLRLHGGEIESLQILGVNSLKSVTPRPEALRGQTIEGTEVAGRILRILTKELEIRVDLQRTGRLSSLQGATGYSAMDVGLRPTVRLLLADGTGIDLSEPSKTKRITVTLQTLEG